MGLDMYLTKHWYLSLEERVGLKIEFPAAPTPSRIGMDYPQPALTPDTSKVCEIVEEAGYWRKANAIHRWFVENVQDGVDNCARYHVDREKLTALLELVKQVLLDHSNAPDLLPTQKGFFFGDRGYDEQYYENLEHTKNVLMPLLEESGFYDIYYHASW